MNNIRSSDHKLRDWFVYLAIGVGFVLLTVVGTFLAPRLTDHIFNWLGFSIVTALVFGYELHDFWSYRRTLRFWLLTISLFVCHFEFWVHWVRPRFGGDPGRLAGGTIAVIELVIVSVIMGVILPAKRSPHGSKLR
jgi:uncharacterized membrane protein YfcA